MGEILQCVVNKEVQDLFDNYDVLTEANNSIKGLERIEPFIPLKVDSKVENIPYKSKVQELTDKVHKAAVQLSKHYDGVANDNSKFIPYWNQEICFRNAVLDNFSELDKCGWFESFNKYCKRHNLEGRLELDEQLNHFKPFFEKYSWGTYKDNVGNMCELKFNRWLDRVFGYTLSLLVGLPHITIIKQSTTESLSAGDVVAYHIIASLTLAYASSKLHKIRTGPKNILIEDVQKPMERKAKKADKMISLIKSLAS